MQFAEEGRFNHVLINIEFYLHQIMALFSKDIDYQKDAGITELLMEFATRFKIVQMEYLNKEMVNNGFLGLPLHRIFAPILIRLLLQHLYDPSLNYFEQLTFHKKPLSKVFTKILCKFVDRQTAQQLMESCILGLTLQVSFIHELLAKKWVYYDAYLNYFPTVYFKNDLNASFRDLALTQMLIASDFRAEDSDINELCVE